MIRVTDYIAAYIYQQGVREVFMVSGGGMMFLSDGLACYPQLRVVCNHHEQASAMAATAYAKCTENLGVAYLTTGCGGTNAITGLLGAWQDNVPCLFVSGQSKRSETVRNSGLRLRQFGVQEADIVEVVKPLTKYAVMINDPQEIAYHLEKATWLARTGRPGPVWLDVPMDVQAALVDENNLLHFTPDGSEAAECNKEPTETDLAALQALIANSRRPIVIAGHGIRLAKSIPAFKQFIEGLQIPFVASRLGIDLLPSDHPLFIGRIGTKGDRAGNFAVQNSDLVLSLGSRLSVSSTGHEYDKFAREASVVVVDIDPEEHKKRTVRIDRFIHADLRALFARVSLAQAPDCGAWVETCRRWKERWPVCLPEYAQETRGVNMYYFVDTLSRCLKSDSVVVSDAGSAFFVVAQAIKLQAGQRWIATSAQAEMGNTLPASIGACFARGRQEVIGITGDGSFQMNIQELQTLVHHRLPVKIFVWNNDGYLSIRATQSTFFESRFIGTDSVSGVSFPSVEKIAGAYGLKYFLAASSSTVETVIREVLAVSGPVLCEVIVPRDQEVVPSVSSVRRDDGSMVSKPIEDMYPFLSREEFLGNMIVKPVRE